MKTKMQSAHEIWGDTADRSATVPDHGFGSTSVGYNLRLAFWHAQLLRNKMSAANDGNAVCLAVFWRGAE